jgi:hypothetical protein
MHFVPVTPENSLGDDYAYQEIPGGPGEIRFLREDIDLVPGEQKEKMAAVSRWTRDQGGMAIVEVTGGDVPTGSTTTLVECWDASFRTTYSRQSGRTNAENEEGDASSCPDVSALGE